MIQRLMLSCLTCLTLVVAGCAGQGETYIAYERGQQTNTIPAPKTGEYALYAGSNDTPKVVVKLNKGEKLGFDGRRRLQHASGCEDQGCDLEIAVTDGQ